MIDFTKNTNKVLIYADQAFSNQVRKTHPLRAKTADGYIRYGQTAIAGVVDSTATEANVSQILGIREDIKIYQLLEQYISTNAETPDILLIGIAPSGGNIGDRLYKDIVYAIEHGMNIMNGMHYELAKDKLISEIAQKNNVSIWDTRIPTIDNYEIASCKAYFIKKPIILTCAADAAIGKMTVGFEIEQGLYKKGIKGELLATGQTSIMIKGKGISIDRVIGDFMPGAMESLLVNTEEENPDNRFYIIEGQGGLIHPGYAPVSLALLHGAMPTHAILVQRPQRRHSIGSKIIKIPSINETVNMYRTAALPIRKPEFIGIAINGQGLDSKEIGYYINKYKDETGLPVEDMINFKTGEIINKVEQIILNYK